MSERKEGVKDAMRVDPDCENAVVEGWPYKGPQYDTVYTVDDEGYLRDDDGDLKPWVGPGVVATDVDPETWGDHYHNPADCPEKDLPTHRPERTTCDACTVAVDREHDRDYYRPEPTESGLSPDELRDAIEEMNAAFADPPRTPRLMVGRETHGALQTAAKRGGGE